MMETAEKKNMEDIAMLPTFFQLAVGDLPERR